jgi:hypothetical protein
MIGSSTLWWLAKDTKSREALTKHSHLTVVEVCLDIGMSSAYCVAGTAGELTDCCGVV